MRVGTDKENASNVVNNNAIHIPTHRGEKAQAIDASTTRPI